MQKKSKIVGIAVLIITLIAVVTGTLITVGTNEKAVSVSKTRKYVIPGGEIFGVRMYTDGIVVVAIDNVVSKTKVQCPANEAGLKVGDVIKAINGIEVTKISDISNAVTNSKGKSIQLLIERNQKMSIISFEPVLSKTDNRYKAGIWVRESSAGVGTITYYDRENMSFAGLGHAICDIDTGEVMPLLKGEIVGASVLDVYKATKKDPGELCGVFTDDVLGLVLENNTYGVYGKIMTIKSDKSEIPVAIENEIRTGKAQIIATVDSVGPAYYNIRITNIYRNSENENRNMAIEVTDEKLIEKTGGIVQGMSGSPIIQNGMLVGAVTHVFQNNPLKGYAIFAENMLTQSTKVEKDIIDAAS